MEMANNRESIFIIFYIKLLTIIIYLLFRPSLDEIRLWSESFDKLMKCLCKYIVLVETIILQK